ncbi:MAG: ATP-binding protein [Nitrospirales bacterium]
MDRNQSKTWSEHDLQSLIDYQVQEDSHLEYKDSRSLQKTDPKRMDISKNVSSFANAGGGIIVYGICENGENHLPERLDEGVDPVEFQKEWLEQVIQGQIIPRIGGIHINQVSLDLSSPRKVAYVVTIPQGETAHQASDNKYYKRFNFNSVPMEHYEILDVLNRNRYPNVIPTFEIPSDYEETSKKRSFRVFLENKGSVSAKTISLTVYWPCDFGFSQNVYGAAPAWQIKKSLYNGALIECSVYLKDRVLFPEEKAPLNDLLPPSFAHLYFHAFGRHSPTAERFLNLFRESELGFRWKIFADDMPPKSGDVLFNEIFQERDFFYYER